ncbi:MAG: hypothetical protein JWO03_3979 [Bacteroidetes bacterium]|nr:hypothetical protein [Bacteroidota bacterium]
MKQPNLLFTTIILFCSISLFAQSVIPNGGFEAWSGIDTVRPDGWVTTEQMQGLRINKWVTQETRPAYVKTGSSAIRLSADTVNGKAPYINESYGAFIHRSVLLTNGKTGAVTTAEENYTYMPGIISAGRPVFARGHITASGVALNSRPVTLSFYVRMNHPVTDTASVRILLTRWNPSRGTQDTVAIDREDIFPDSSAMTGYTLFTDTIDYRLLGDADTARITIYGGRMKNVAARGNVTWIDGISFGYSLPAALRSSALSDSVWLTPNPVMNQLTVKADSGMQGYKIIIQAETSVIVKEITISTLNMTVDMTDVPVGNYSYALLDRDERKIRKGYISVLRN